MGPSPAPGEGPVRKRVEGMHPLGAPFEATSQSQSTSTQPQVPFRTEQSRQGQSLSFVERQQQIMQAQHSQSLQGQYAPGIQQQTPTFQGNAYTQQQIMQPRHTPIYGQPTAQLNAYQQNHLNTTPSQLQQSSQHTPKSYSSQSPLPTHAPPTPPGMNSYQGPQSRQYGHPQEFHRQQNHGQHRAQTTPSNSVYTGQVGSYQGQTVCVDNQQAASGRQYQSTPNVQQHQTAPHQQPA